MNTTPYIPAEWQQRHPIGSRMLHGRQCPAVVRVGKAHRTGVRVKFLTGPATGQWQTVHPEGLHTK